MRMYRFSAAVIRTESIIIIENDKFDFHPVFFVNRKKTESKSFNMMSKIYVVFGGPNEINHARQSLLHMARAATGWFFTVLSTWFSC